MKVRPISQDELEPFVNTSKANREVLQKHLLHAWSEGTSKPEWCFVAESKNSFTGGIAYEIDKKTKNLAIFHLDAGDELDNLAIKDGENVAYTDIGAVFQPRLCDLVMVQDLLASS